MAGVWGIAAKFAVFTLACIVGLVFLANTMANRVSGGAVEYSADFTNASGLRPGDDVRAAGVKVGRIDEVALRNGKAHVSFTLAEQQPMTTTTRLTLRYQSLLGQKYLALARGETPGNRVPPGSTLPVSQTDPGFDLTALLNGFEPLFATLKPEEVNQLAESIVAVLQGQGGTIESLLGQTATLTNRLADDGDLIEQVLVELTPVLQDIASRGDEVDQTINDLRSLMRKLDEEHEHIGESLDGVSKLSTAAADLVDEARAPLRHDIRTLREFSRISVEQRTAINLLFAGLPVGAGAFGRPFSTGAWLQMYICNMSGEVGGLEVPFGAGPTGEYSAACR